MSSPLKVYWFTDTGLDSEHTLNETVTNLSNGQFKFVKVDEGGRANPSAFMLLSVAAADIVVIYFSKWTKDLELNKREIQRMLQKVAHLRVNPVPVLVLLNKSSPEVEEPSRAQLKIKHGFVVETVTRSLNSQKDAAVVIAALRDIKNQPINLDATLSTFITFSWCGLFSNLIGFIIWACFGKERPFDKTSDQRYGKMLEDKPKVENEFKK